MAKKQTRRGTRGSGTSREAANKVLKDQFDNPTKIELDKKYQSSTEDIRGKLEESRGKLAELDPETRAAFDEQRKAEEALQRRQFAQQQDTLLTRLFGQGRTEGTLAGDLGGRLVGDQQLVLQQLAAADSSNRMNARMGITQQGLQNLGMQGGLAQHERESELQRLGMESGERQNMLRAAAGLESTHVGADAQRDTARIGASAQIRSTQISSDAGIQRARIAASASRYGADQSLNATRISAAAGVRSSQIGAAASRHNALTALEGQKYSSDRGFQSTAYGVDSRERQFGSDLDYRYAALGQQGDLARQGFQNQIDLAHIQGNYQMQGINAQQPSSNDKFLGFAGGLLSIFSDEKLKEDIEPIQRPLRKVQGLDGYHFTWIDDQVRSTGVIAQEVQKVLPTAVREVDGDLVVDYTQVIALLVAAVNELAEKVAKHE